MKRVIFVLNCIEDSLCKKRIEEFIENGFHVSVYGYIRNSQMQPVEGGIVLADMPNSMSYLKRLPVLRRTLSKLIRKEKGDDVVWYFFGLDIALISFLINPRIKFVYENADLSYTKIKYSVVSGLFKKADQLMVRKSLATVFTSEGFVKYHYGDKCPDNVILKPNKINKHILELPSVKKKEVNTGSLRFAFVGLIRYMSIFNMADVISRSFPNHSFHFYGIFSDEKSDEAKAFKALVGRPNVFFHGRFNNPADLPEIYSNIDVVVSTYDVTSDNVRYAEPNKIYESIFFRTPIIVSKGTFLADKVKELGSGFAVDAMDERAIIEQVRQIEEEIFSVIDRISKVPQEYAINESEVFFKRLREFIS